MFAPLSSQKADEKKVQKEEEQKPTPQPQIPEGNQEHQKQQLIISSSNQNPSASAQSCNEETKSPLEAKEQRKRHRHNRKAIKRSPEYFKELKLHKKNIKREQDWRNDFVLASIPSRPPRIKAGRLRSHTRPRSPFKTVQKARLHFTNKTEKLFQIRVIKNGRGLKQQTLHQQKSNTVSAVSEETSRYKMRIDELYNHLQFPPFYKALLQDFSENLNNEKKKILEEELALLQKKESLMSRLIESIGIREKLLKQLSSLKEKGGMQLENAIETYRKATLLCIQTILKWKSKWKRHYGYQSNSPKQLVYIYQGIDYLVKMRKDSAEHLNNQIQQDVFLLSVAPIDPNDKQTLLKIRASELFLLEEQLLSSK